MKVTFTITAVRENPDDHGRVSPGAFVGQWSIEYENAWDATWQKAMDYARSCPLNDAVFVNITRSESA